MTAPHYVAGIDFDPAVRQDAFDVMARLIEHYRNKSTDQAPDQWREPVRNYRDPDLWEREIKEVFRTVPLPLAMSCELPEPGTYKAIDVAGTPVVITRDPGGSVRAMINVCRHRGSELVAEGTGRAHRLTCPYHAWSYDLKGCLLGVYGEDTFGGVDRDRMGLVALPAAERAGLIFVSLDPKATIDLDQWLGAELIMLLEAMALDKVFHYSTRTLAGPNWKVVIDGYLEGYHFASLRSEEHTSELQSRRDLVCRLLLEKKDWREFRQRQSNRGPNRISQSSRARRLLGCRESSYPNNARIDFFFLYWGGPPGFPPPPPPRPFPA